jgi:AraC family transcriptional regulator
MQLRSYEHPSKNGRAGGRAADQTGGMTDWPPARDRLRELLDAVLDEEHRTLGEMAEGAYSSPYHFSRLLSRDAGEPPVAMRRRVMLERAAWQLKQGSTVTDAAFAAGYESVEGFARAFAKAFGHPPSETVGTDRGHWLPAPNGIHFHPPTSLWVHTTEQMMNPLTEQMVHHDVDDTRFLLDRAKQLTETDYTLSRFPGATVLRWDGADDSIRAVLEHLVWTKEVWVAAIEGHDLPSRQGTSAAELVARHETVAGAWLGVVRDIDRRGAWEDRIVDALCDPPESFVLASVVAHVLTFSAHRRQLVRQMLRMGGHAVDHGDPIDWLRQRHEPGREGHEGGAA